MQGPAPAEENLKSVLLFFYAIPLALRPESEVRRALRDKVPIKSFALEAREGDILKRWRANKKEGASLGDKPSWVSPFCL